MADEMNEQTPFSDKQVEALKGIVAGIVNSAIANRDKMSDKKRADDLKAAKDEWGKLLDEKLSSFKPAPEDEGGGKDKGKGGGKGENVELATLRKQQTEMQARLDAAEKKAAESRARERATALRQKTGEHLAKIANIDGSRFKLAFAALQQDGRIKYRDDDTDDLVFVDDAGTEVELEVGLSAWLKTDEAKLVLPPSGTKGAGTRPTNGGGSSPKLSPEQQQEAAWTAAGEAIRSAFSNPSGSL